MTSEIKNIVIIYEQDAGDLSIDASSLINFIETKKEESFSRIYEKLVIEFYFNKEAYGYETNSLVFHENKINRIVVNYNNLPTFFYSLSKYPKETNNNTGFDYDFKVLETAQGKMHVLLEVNCSLYKDVVTVKEEDVLIMDEKENNKPKYNVISSLTFSCLIFKNNGKLVTKKTNLRWLDSSYVVKAKRINLTKQDDKYVILQEQDFAFLDLFFGEKYKDYLTYLNKVQKKILLDIKKIVASRGCDLVIIHSFKYRVNQNEGMFNVLIEYLCCKR